MRSTPRSILKPAARLAAFTAALLTGALLTGTAHAQGGADVPLVSLGDALRWAPATETYTLRVPASAANTPVGLEVFSPGLNRTDLVGGRASATYAGDELYAQTTTFDTTFTLNGPGGVVFERSFRETDRHAWESLWSSPLPAGTYTLLVSSKGNGKNAFSLRTSPDFALEAPEFTVNVRGTPGQDLVVARLTVPRDWAGRTVTLGNFDGDGAEEVSLTLVLPGGERRPLTVSGNNVAVTDAVPVTPDLVGEWTVVASVPARTKQISNAITVRAGAVPAGTSTSAASAVATPQAVRLPGFTPPADAVLQGLFTVEIVDGAGRPVPGATYAVQQGVVRPRFPLGYAPASATAEGATVIGAGEVRLTGGTARLRFVARVQEGGLSVDAVAVWGGQRVPLAGVPVEVAGRTVTVPATLQLAPGEYRVTPGAVPGATAEARTGRVTDGAGGRVTLEYAVRADLSMLVSPDLVDACDVTTLTVTARTDFPYRLPSGLKLDLPNGWTSDYPRELRGDLSSSSPLRLRTPVRVCRGDAAQASLENTSLLATGEARVRNPPGATVRRVMAGSNVRLTKSVASAETGYVVTLVLTADSVVENLRVLDPLPSGGSTPALRGQLTVQGPTSGPGLAGGAPRLDGDTIWLGRVTPGQYTLTYTLFTDVGPERVVTAPELLW